MVLWIRKHPVIFKLLLALVLATTFNIPYLTKDFLGIEHDTFFHLSRITGLADSIREDNLFPCIYPNKNNGFGYASPLFYCDFFMIIPALFYLLGVSLANSYKLIIFIFTFFSAFTMADLLYRTSKNNKVVLIGTFAYIFSNYHITDVYVRGALGEVAAMIFLPVLLSAIYEILYHFQTSKWYLLTIAFTGLILSHNLSFLLGFVLFICFSFIRIRLINKSILYSLFKGCLTAFLLTIWFTLPMLEQTSYQELYLHYYGSYSSLESYTIPIWKYFANKTIFGYGENSQPTERAMLVNVGYFLTLVPVLYLCKKKKNKFILHSCILGYIFLLLPSNLIPWKFLFFVRIIQFPWRLELLAMVLLCIPASSALLCLAKKKRMITTLLCIFFFIIEGIYHLYPVYSRTFGITSLNTYQDITQGKLCNPYYSATYMRVELAGGDYLPLDSIDFRDYTPTIKTASLEETNISYQKEGTTLTFTVDDSFLNKELVLPVTIYKGYHIYFGDIEVPVQRFKGLIAFTPQESGTYILKYEPTLLRKVCCMLSLMTVIYLILLKLKHIK